LLASYWGCFSWSAPGLLDRLKLPELLSGGF
jgi:hypothetical protein